MLAPLPCHDPVLHHLGLCWLLLINVNTLFESLNRHDCMTLYERQTETTTRPNAIQF